MNDTTLKVIDFRHADKEIVDIAFDAEIEHDAQLLHRGMRDYLRPFPIGNVACCLANISTDDLERELDELAGSIYREDEVK